MFEAKTIITTNSAIALSICLHFFRFIKYTSVYYNFFYNTIQV